MKGSTFLQCSENKNKCKFWIGIGLILSSYVAWAATLILAALALRKRSDFLYFVTTAVYILNWVFFGAGLILAGKEGVRYSKSLLRKMWRFVSRKNKSDQIESSE